MTVFRKGRFLFWLARELSHKYTRALFIGIMLGFALVAGATSAFPFVRTHYLVPTSRIGIIGDYTPSSLPPTILSKLSFGLTMLGPDGSPSASFAQSWEATNSGKRYVFRLRNDLTWANGLKVVASDVNYNIRGVKFSAPDDTTLIADLSNAYSPFPSLLTKPILKPGLVGFGEYRVESVRLKGDRISYLKLVPVEKGKGMSYEYLFYRTEAAAVLAFKLGDIDAIEDLDAVDPTLLAWPNATIEKHERNDRIVTLYFNLQDQFLKEKTVRQALAYGIPDLRTERALSPISKTSWAYTDTTKRYPYDPKQAKKTLSAMKPATESASLTIHTFSQYLDTAQAIASSWNDIGIKTDIRVENSLPAKYQVLVSAFDLPADPDQYTLWHSTQTSTNIASYVNVKIDKLLEDARQETDYATRKKLYVDFQKRLVDDSPAVFLFYPTRYSIRRK